MSKTSANYRSKSKKTNQSDHNDTEPYINRTYFHARITTKWKKND
jgi:hypothetical protein